MLLKPGIGFHTTMDGSVDGAVGIKIEAIFVRQGWRRFLGPHEFVGDFGWRGWFEAWY